MYRELEKEKTEKGIKRDYYVDHLLKKSDSNTLITGQQYIGKSTIAKRALAKLTGKIGVYVDLEKISLVPEHFSVAFIETDAGYYLKKEIGLEECGLNDGTKEIIAKVKNELEKIKPNHNLLLQLAFSYSEELSKLAKKKVFIVIDEFWRLLDLNNFDQIKDILEIFSKYALANKNTNYALVGSAVWLMNKINKSLGLEVMEVKALGLRESGSDDVHYYSQGLILYVEVLRGSKNVREKFIGECLTKNKIIYNACRSKLDEALSRARGKALLFGILKILCSSNGMRLNEISRKLYRSAAVTKSLITRLVEVDLVVQDGRLFRFNDPILKFWFRNFVQGNEFENEPDKNTMKKIEVDI